MRTPPLVLSACLLALPARTTIAQTATPTPLQLRWELVGDSVVTNDQVFSRAAFTLTNRDTKPLGASGWAIYFSALQWVQPGSVTGGFTIEDVISDLHRLVPGPGFAGLAPGASTRIEYVTEQVANLSSLPAGAYVVLDDGSNTARALDLVTAPFNRPAQGAGHDPRVVTPEAQFALDSGVRDIPASDLPLVFPTPVAVARGAGEMRLTALPAIAAPDSLSREASFAAEYLRPFVGTNHMRAVPLILATGTIVGQTSPEAYELIVDPAGGSIRITGASPAGVFYGLQTLRGLLPVTPAKGGVVLPAIRVVDAPRFPYRGFMLDVARNFQPKASVLRMIDLLARYKINVLHLHLTDDEGWRLEIPSLPELTSVGGRRGFTLDSRAFLPSAFGSGPAADKPWGSGFFSRADYQEILRYAAARHIEVIPEIEMPGHARAAIKAMDARAAAGDKQYLLRDPNDTSLSSSAQGYHDNVMNPTLESTYAFIERVVSDIVAMHRDAGVPLRHIHMGGDEVPPGSWQGSPLAQAYMQAHGIKSVDDLWFIFYGRIEQILKAHDLPLSGWEEIAVRKTVRDGRPTNIPNPQFAARGWRAYVWNNVPGWGAEDLAYRLANGGYQVVLSPVSNLYFDLAWNQNPEERGLDWGGYVDLRKPYEFIPFDYYRNSRVDRRGNPLDPAVFVGKERLTDYGRANIVGIQGNLWAETLGGEGRMEYMLVPRLFALAERAWAPVPDWVTEKDSARSEALYRDAWSRFVNVLGKRELPRLDREAPGLSYRIPTPGLMEQGGMVRCSVELPGFTLRYTTDGSEPTAKSPVVRGPLPFGGGTISVAAFSTTGRKGHTARITASTASR